MPPRIPLTAKNNSSFWISLLSPPLIISDGVVVLGQIFTVVSFLSCSLLWLFQNVTLSMSTTSLASINRQPPSLIPEILEVNTPELFQHPGTSGPTSTSHPPSTHLLSLLDFICFSPDTMKAVFLIAKLNPYKFWILSSQLFSPILSTFSGSFPPISEIKKQITTFHQPFYSLEIKFL